jgi:hypothetical protein
VLVALAAGSSVPAMADTTVGNIEVCYFCMSGFGFSGLAFQDGPIFEINNTTGTNLTGVLFTVAGDTLNVGTVAANSSMFVVPGVTTDGSTHSGFWTHLSNSINGVLDTSEVGPSDNSTQFLLTGVWGGRQRLRECLRPRLRYTLCLTTGRLRISISWVAQAITMDHAVIATDRISWPPSLSLVQYRARS